MKDEKNSVKGTEKEKIFEAENPEQAAKKAEKRLEKKIDRIVGVVITSMFIAFLIICRIDYTPTASMENTIRRKTTYISLRNPENVERGDIVVFVSPDGDGTYCKRIIAMGGDHLEIDGQNVYLNGEKLYEHYIKDGMTEEAHYVFDVPEGYIFLMGDNRKDSFDSRYWDEPYVSVDDVKGKVLFKAFPFGLLE